MGLARLALRLAAMSALTARTFARDRIADSDLGGILEIAREQGPAIAISTDNDEREARGTDLAGGSRAVELLIDLYVASAVTISADGEERIVTPYTADGMEFALDLFEWQVMRALLDPVSPGSEMFRRMAARIRTVASRRAAYDQQGVLFSARQIVIVIEPLVEPGLGSPMIEGGPWTALLALMESDPDLHARALVLRALIEGPALPDWRQAQMALGLTSAAIAAIGLAPVDTTETGEAAIARGAIIGDWVVDEAAIAAQHPDPSDA